LFAVELRARSSTANNRFCTLSQRFVTSA